MHGVRRKGRSCALQMLYQKELNSDWDSSMVEMFWHFSGGSKKVRSFATELFEATTENLLKIDSNLSEVLEDWKLNRLSVVIRNLLRMAVCEMIYLKTASFQVVINEAVELARDFMDEDSAKFVNSVLDKCILDKNGEKPDKQSP